jgi:hypothetical protein
LKFYFGKKENKSKISSFKILFFEIFREKPDVILLQQVGTFSLTLIITCLSSLYDDESIQIGIYISNLI